MTRKEFRQPGEPGDGAAWTRDRLRRTARDTATPADLLARLGREGGLSRDHEVRRALASNPATPPATARRLIGTLFWNALADVCRDPRIHPLVRREAERLLELRLDEMAVGERIALAVRAPRGLLRRLCLDPEAGVRIAILDNPRLIESEAVGVAAASGSTGPVLARLATHGRWCGRAAVRRALLSNRRTPIAAALGIVRRMERRELRALSADGKVPQIVRIGAQRRLSELSSGPSGSIELDRENR